MEGGDPRGLVGVGQRGKNDVGEGRKTWTPKSDRKKFFRIGEASVGMREHLPFWRAEANVGGWREDTEIFLSGLSGSG